MLITVYSSSFKTGVVVYVWYRQIVFVDQTLVPGIAKPVLYYLSYQERCSTNANYLFEPAIR